MFRAQGHIVPTSLVTPILRYYRLKQISLTANDLDWVKRAGYETEHIFE